MKHSPQENGTKGSEATLNEEYLSVKAFAKAVNISPQAVYQRLKSKKNDEIKKYTRIEDGRTVINIQARVLFEKVPERDAQEQEVNTSSTIDKELINTLTAQLEAKDKQIDRLHRLLENEQTLSLGYRKELTAARDKQQALEAELSEYKAIPAPAAQEPVQAPTDGQGAEDPAQDQQPIAPPPELSPLGQRIKRAFHILTGRE